jgi:hypothetical protein
MKLQLGPDAAERTNPNPSGGSALSVGPPRPIEVVESTDFQSGGGALATLCSSPSTPRTPRTKRCGIPLFLRIHSQRGLPLASRWLRRTADGQRKASRTIRLPPPPRSNLPLRMCAPIHHTGRVGYLHMQGAPPGRDSAQLWNPRLGGEGPPALKRGSSGCTARGVERWHDLAEARDDWMRRSVARAPSRCRKRSPAGPRDIPIMTPPAN